MTSLRSKLIHLAHEKPELRPALLPLLKKTGASDVPVQFGIVTQDDFPNAKWTITGRARELYYAHIHKPGEIPRWSRGRAEKMLVQMWRLSKLSKSGVVEKIGDSKASGEEFDRKAKELHAKADRALAAVGLVQQDLWTTRPGFKPVLLGLSKGDILLKSTELAIGSKYKEKQIFDAILRWQVNHDKAKRMEARAAKSRLGEYGHGEHERGRLASGKILISVDVPATIAAREKYSAFESIVVAKFEQSTPLYRIFDDKELKKILASGKITGGTYSVRAEREFGASWGANISAVINFGNRQRGSRLGDKLYLAKIDGLDFRFAHLNLEVTFDPQGPDQQEVHMDRERCSPALGCSLVNVSLADVDAFYEVFPDDRIERLNLRDLS